jgi:hypothetical protein
MTWAEFEEKEYESAAFGELMRPDASGPSVAFSAGQVLEKVVGYDAAAAPSPEHAAWRILQAPRPPGVRLLPAMWAPGPQPADDRLPSTPVTLVLQFKRPEYLYGATAGQWRFWHQPYFRFARQTEQQRVLATLERNVGDSALVRYAAPAFWQRGHLEAAHLRGEVVQTSGFVSPRHLARHHWWTYVAPGIDGRANPAGSSARFEAREDLYAALFDRPSGSTDIVPAETLGEHIERVGVAARRTARATLRRRVERWQSDLRDREPQLAPETVRRVGDLAMLNSLLTTIDATWLVVAAAN